MNEKISALVDGELERREADAAFEALGAEGAARDTWRAYHLISDSMHDTRLLSGGFAARVAARLAGEPTVLAPRRRPILEQRRWQVLSGQRGEHRHEHDDDEQYEGDTGDEPAREPSPAPSSDGF